MDYDAAMQDPRVAVLFIALLAGCDARTTSTTHPPEPAPVEPVAAPVAAATAAPAPAATPVATVAEGPAMQPAGLEPGRGKEVGPVFEAYLSPHQEGGEEEDTPKSVPSQFRSSAPSLSRAAREAAGHRAHGQVRFSKDLSRAFIDVKIEGVDPATVNMFHIHCGKPGILGPILVDFALATDLKRDLADGVMTVEIRNEHIVKNVEHAHGVVAAFTAGCIVPSLSLAGLKPTKVSTVAGMYQLALERELYFNLHTTSQTYFGDIRGQLHPVAER
jgi:hypothetical protein